MSDSKAHADQSLQHARAATLSERESCEAWILTRAATQQQSQNPEVLRRTQALDKLKEAESAQEREVETLETRQTALEQDKAAHERRIGEITRAGESGTRVRCGGWSCACLACGSC